MIKFIAGTAKRNTNTAKRPMNPNEVFAGVAVCSWMCLNVRPTWSSDVISGRDISHSSQKGVVKRPCLR